MGILADCIRAASNNSRVDTHSITVPGETNGCIGYPARSTNVLTTPILISNDGLTDLEALKAQTFFKRIEYPGNNVMEYSIARSPMRGHKLAIGEKETVQPYQLLNYAAPPGFDRKIVNLDFALMFEFRPAYWPFSKKRFFRFDVVTNSSGTQRLRQIPAGDIDRDYDATVKKTEEMRRRFAPN